jgi:hypothetical protein
MKTGYLLLTAALLNLLPFFSSAQCVTPQEVISFDTIVTGSGNANHSFTFPKFNPSQGTLMEVNIKTEASLTYRFQLENRESVAINNYRVRVVRDDEVSGSALQTPLDYTHQATYGPYSLAASDGVPGSGSDYMAAGPVYVMNRQMMQSTVNNTADFLGNGTVSLDYTATTYSIVFGSVNYNFNGTAEDTVRFTVTYRYCSTSFLAADVTSFNAVPRNNETVDVSWTALNERSGRVYTIEKSANGRDFSAVTKLNASNGNYLYNYVPAGNETGKIIFRLRQTERDGAVKYSSLRIVDLHRKQETGIRIYPNPSNGVFNVMFSNTRRGDWEITVLTMQGQVIGTYNFTRALQGRIHLDTNLAKGVYLIKAVNKKNQEQFGSQLFIR